MRTRLLTLALAFCIIVGASQAAPVSALVFSPDGQELVSNAHAKIQRRSVEDGQVLESFPSNIPRMTSLAFSPSGRLLAVAGGLPGFQGELAIIDWASRTTLFHTTNAADINSSVAFNQDGQLVATSSADFKAAIYQVGEDGLPTKPIALAGHTAPVLGLAFDPLTSNLVTVGADRSLKVWSREGQMLRTMSYHTEAVNALTFRPVAKGSRSECASGSDDGSVRTWQPEIGRMVRIVRGHRGSILALAFHPSGLSLFTAGKEAIIRQIDASSDHVIGSMPTHQDWIYSMAIHPKGNALATGDWKGDVRVWKLRHDAARGGWVLP